MSSENIKEMIQAHLQTEIVKALNTVPEALEKLVRAAITQSVDANTGNTESRYGGRMVSYIDYLAGNEIRHALREAVRRHIEERNAEIVAAVQAQLSTDEVAKAFVKAVTGTLEESWRIDVNFAVDKDR